MTSQCIVLTLGHNSSAILVNDGKIVCGYEEERFTEVKSDSKFPVNALNEIRQRYIVSPHAYVAVGHWFLDGQLPKEKNKYWDPGYIKEMCPHGEVLSLSTELTHHDSHMLSARVFAGKDWPEHSYILVMDGFGTMGECISMYVTGQIGVRLVRRVFGFRYSLGMLYQYSTAFQGMKMHNHEYKQLAYETHIDEIGVNLSVVHSYIEEKAGEYLKYMNDPTRKVKGDPMLSVEALPQVQQDIGEMLEFLLVITGKKDAPEYEKRVLLSYFTQRMVETIVSIFVRGFPIENLLVVGGLFYNVKLNSMLSKQIKGKFCAMPLAGDQGAGLGVYEAYMGDLEWPGHLFWGHREIGHGPGAEGMVLAASMDEARPIILNELERIGFVNLVRGSMEFGPRALCNTSTLAYPEMSIARTINECNDRTMEMPFAPVMTVDEANKRFTDVDKIHKSLEYMIVTRDYRPREADDMLGAAHFYPEDGSFTGRPQITKDPNLIELMMSTGPLINTSFNYHGVPIVRSEEQIVKTHLLERHKRPDLDIKTIVIRSEE